MLRGSGRRGQSEPHWQAESESEVSGCLSLSERYQARFRVACATVTRMTQTNRYVCASCAERGMFATSESYSTIKAVKIHIGKSSVCQAARKGIKEIEPDKRHTDAMVGGTGAAGPPPDLRHQPPGQRYFL